MGSRRVLSATQLGASTLETVTTQHVGDRERQALYMIALKHPTVPQTASLLYEGAERIPGSRSRP